MGDRKRPRAAKKKPGRRRGKQVPNPGAKPLRKRAAKEPEPFTPAAWLAFHARGDRNTRWGLDRVPGGPQLLKQMLESMQPGAVVVWARVRDYIRQQFPKAPTGAVGYKHYAVRVLGWRDPKRGL